MNIHYDSTPPAISLLGSISDGDSFDFGDVPAASTCTATDNLSGMDGERVVTGYDSKVGAHAMTATAKDKAGNIATSTISYTVLPWTIKGFYRPVDMDPNSSTQIVNIAQNGKTVALKWEIFKTKAGTELTDTSVVKMLKKKLTCGTFTGDPTDEVEVLATGGTVLRYGGKIGQFIYNWQTPKQPNTCWDVTMQSLDGSFITAHFRLR